MKLTARIKSLMITDASMTGTYDVTKGALSFVMEQLTSTESEALKRFYDWLVKNNKTWGHGNLDAVWKEYTLYMQKETILNSSEKELKKALGPQFDSLAAEGKAIV